jgi:hypothetical protein
MKRCECCELPEYSCGKAVAKRQEAEAKKRAAELVSQGWFPAKWPGACRECGSGFDAGALIKGGPYGYHGYLADCCSEVVSGIRNDQQ